jgi:hypothetical protein
MSEKKSRQMPRKFYMPIPPGVPISVLIETAQKFGLTVDEKEIKVPSSEGSIMNPRTLVLAGNKNSLIKAKRHLRKGLEKRLKKLENK